LPENSLRRFGIARSLRRNGVDYDIALAVDLRIDGFATMLHEQYTNAFARQALCVLARFLPATARPRSVAEAQGDLGDCERWWQQIDILVCLALGMPRLAWMMWRAGWRGRV
jgi:hypothetical protein